jgi:hypothetical protein
MGFLQRLFGAEGRDRDLLDDLVGDYRSLTEQAISLRDHAARGRYPWVAEALSGLADLHARHAAWLSEHIQARGGGVPPVAPAVLLVGKSQWERAVAAMEQARRIRRRLVEHFSRWDPDEPESVALLKRIEHETGAALATYESLVMRSDPHALD